MTRFSIFFMIIIMFLFSANIAASQVLILAKRAAFASSLGHKDNEKMETGRGFGRKITKNEGKGRKEGTEGNAEKV